MRSNKPLVLSASLFVLLASAGVALVAQQERLRRAEQRQSAARLAAASAFSMEQQLSRSLSAAYALAAVVRQRGGMDDFDALAAEMFPLYPGLSSIQLAPGGVVRHVYPRLGNEAVLGHDLLHDPDRRFQAREAVETRRLVLAGPFELRQGGMGVVGRLAVFVPDSPAPGKDRLWGFATIVVRLADLVDAARLRQLPAEGYAYELTRPDREHGVVSPIAAAAAPLPVDRVSFPVEVPGSEWTLSIAPIGGWRASPWLPLQYAAVVFSAAVLAGLALVVLQQPERLRREVAERTAELAADVERRRKVEATLSLTQQVVDRAELAVAWAGDDDRLLYTNGAFRRLAGLAAGEAPLAWEALPGLGREAWTAARETLRDASSVTREVVVGSGAGERQALVSIESVHAGDRQLVLLFARDVTSERRAQEQLRQAQKMEAIGQLAGGIAHDFNNLLTGIVAHASLLQEEAPAGSGAAESAEAIAGAARRATELTRQLLGFARRGKLLSAPFDVHAVLREVAQLLERTIDKRIALDVRAQARPSVVRGDAGQLQQAVLNLAVNARDAMPDGGTLTFETAVVTHDAEWCARNPGTSPGAFVSIAVSDTGQGVAAELQDRIFEPFFTTKEPGRGTGMGLAMVYGFARNHGGAVQLTSAGGKGARFTIELPLAQGATVPAADDQRAPSLRGSGLVLVVDDDEVPRAAAASILRRAGYDVVTASSGADAVATFRERSRDLSAVLLDLAMPGMDGAACYEALRALDAGVRVVLTSGYDRDGRPQRLLDAGVVAFVPKPFTPAELAEAVGRAVGSSPRGVRAV